MRLSAAGWLVVCLALTFPINYAFFGGIRIADIIILLLVTISLSELRIRNTAIFSLALSFLALYVVSMTYGIMVHGIVKQSNMLFLYKYLLTFLLVWVMTSRVESGSATARIASFMNGMFLVLVAYAYLYFLLWAVGIVHGNVRVTFPFANDPESKATDAHLYSVVLSTCLVGYLYLHPSCEKRRLVPTIMVIIMTVGAMILSGSRTGLLSTILTFIFIVVHEIFTRLIKGGLRVTARAILAVILVALTAYVALFKLTTLGTKGFDFLLGRIFAFDLSSDVSFGGRLLKARYVLDQIINGPLVIGIGMQSTHHTWFDNAYMAVLFSTGFAGLLVFLCIILLFLNEQKRAALRYNTLRDYTALKYLFVNYLICGFSSEFFLVTRGLVPFAVLVGLFSYRIRNGGATALSPQPPMRSVAADLVPLHAP